eukprot:gene9922-5877_t
MSSFGRGMPNTDWMRGDDDPDDEDPDFNPDDPESEYIDINGAGGGGRGAAAGSRRMYVDPKEEEDGAADDGDGGADGEEQMLDVEQGVADEIGTGGTAGAAAAGSKKKSKCVTIDFRDGVVPEDGTVSFHWHPILRPDSSGGSAATALSGAVGSSKVAFVAKTEFELAAMTFEEQMAYMTAQSIAESEAAEAAALAESAAAAAAAPAAADADAASGEVPMDLDTSSVSEIAASKEEADGEREAKEEEEAMPPFHMNTQTEGGTSSFVYVNPGAFMRVKLPPPAASPSSKGKSQGLTARPGGGKGKHDSWTLTMEVKIDSLPTETPHAILQCNANEHGIQSTVEAELHGIGALTIFDEMPKDVFFKPGRWNRISIRYGSAALARPQMDMHGRGNMHSYMEQASRGPPPRKLSVFINGKLSVELSKGVFTDQGRFSMPKDGFLLFASNNPEAMPGTSIRYLRFDSEHLDDAGIRSAQLTSVYSQWQREKAAADADFLRQLSLKDLYKRPPAVWQELAYICEFGDATVEGTGLDGATSVYGALRVLSFVAVKTWAEQQDALASLPAAAATAVERSLKVLSESTDLCRQFELAQKNPNQLISFVRKFRKRLEELPVEGMLLVPAGFALEQSKHPFVLVLERTAAEEFRVAVVNPGAVGMEQYHPASPTSAVPKIQSRFNLSFSGVERDRLLDDAWWFMLWRTGFVPAKINTPDKFYDDLLPILLDKPLEAAIADNSCHADDLLCPLRSHERSRLTGYRASREAWMYVLHRSGATPADTRELYFCYQQQWLKLLLHDLHCVRSIDESDLKLVRLGIKQTAHVCTKKQKSSDSSRFIDEQLAILERTVDGIEGRIAELPVQSYSEAAKSLDLSAENGVAPLTAKNKEHTLLERFLRKEDISGLAGARTQYPDFVPVDFLLVPEQATTFDHAVDALRWADKLCTLCSAQSRRVKNPQFYKVALLQHLFTKVLPVPRPTDKGKCIWFTPVRYALQLDILLLLKRLFEHFVSSAFAIVTTREFDAVKIVVGSVIVTLADVMLRTEATDIPSEVSQLIRIHGFGITMSPFHEQSETIMVTMPELNVARTGVLDYWSDLGIAEDKCFFNFNESLRPDQATLMLFKMICHEMGFPYSAEMLPIFVSGESPRAGWEILKNFPEIEFFRDICFYSKYLLGTDPEAFPKFGRTYTQKSAELMWKYIPQERRWQVAAFQMELKCPAKGHRWPTFAVASRFTQPHKVLTEDDILHLRELNDFEQSLGQRDSELLLSALTVPYLRIPIVVSFFATENRVHALKSDTLRNLLDSVVFEPGRYLHKGSAEAPKEVPTKNEKLLNTPYGLLLNELARSPSQVVLSTIKLLKLALGLDAGSYFASQSTIIMYLLRFGCRVENHIRFVLDYAAGKTHATLVLRDTEVHPDVVAFLKEGHSEIRELLERKFQRMLRSWTNEVLARATALQEAARHKKEAGGGGGAGAEGAEGVEAAGPTDGAAALAALNQNSGAAGTGGSSAGDSHLTRMQQNAKRSARKFKRIHDEKLREVAEDYDKLFEVAADLRAHQLTMYRNCSEGEWDEQKLGKFVALFTFLSARHSWNAKHLSLPEPEIFEVFQSCRRTLVTKVTKMKMNLTNMMMEKTASLVADAEQQLLPRGWGTYASMSAIGVPAARQRGRFGVCESSARCMLNNATAADGMNRTRPIIDEMKRELDMGVEINLQFCTLTLKSNHLQALNQPMSTDADVVAVFGLRSLQCALVEEAEHRTWYRFIGREHDLQWWDPDSRGDLQVLDREYDPSGMHPAEQWITNMFEPIRLQNYVPPVVQEPIPFVIREQEYTAADDVAVLHGVDPAGSGNLIEVVLIKSLRTVNVYLIESFGRRFWRTQCYSSDSRHSLRFLQPGWKDRKSKWAPWARYEAGKAGLPEPAPSAVITREANVKDNMSGTEEMFVPT